MRCYWKPAILLALLICSATWAQGETRGLYVYSWEVATTYSPAQTTKPGVSELLAALNTPGVDGITLVEKWSSLEPVYRTFEWTGVILGTTPVDLWIQEAIKAGKHVNLAIDAGQDTPCWLFLAVSGNCSQSYNGTYAGAAALDFQVSAHQGRGKCTPETIAAPWDPVFLQEWKYMVSGLSAYLQSVPYGTGSEYDAITMVRLTGINRTTDEFRIPAEILSTKHGAGCDTNSVETWLQAGYRPSRLFDAWDRITDDFQSDFGDKYLNVPIIPTNSGSKANLKAGNGQFPLPPIDENGCVYLIGVPIYARPDFASVCTYAPTVQVPDQDLSLVTLATQKFAGKLTVEYENLHFTKGQPAPPSPPVVHYAETLGTVPAFQTNNYYGPFPTNPGGTSCGPLGSLRRCSPGEYREMVGAGISPDATDSFLRSQFIEIFFPDIGGNECASIANPPAGCGYPDEIGGAPHPNLHDDLIDPPLVTISFPTSSPATHWYTTLPLKGNVTSEAAAGNTTKSLDCTGAASGSGTAGFALDVKSQGNPDLVKCTSTDSAGHMGESIRALWIDTEAPVTTAAVVHLPALATVNFTATDNLSGVARTEYSLNGITWTPGTSVTVGIGTHLVRYRSIDVAGNVEATKSVPVVVLNPPPPPPCKGTACI